MEVGRSRSAKTWRSGGGWLQGVAREGEVGRLSVAEWVDVGGEGTIVEYESFIVGGSVELLPRERTKCYGQGGVY